MFESHWAHKKNSRDGEIGPPRLAPLVDARLVNMQFTMNYYIYIILSCSYKKTYTGITNDLDRRLKQHNSGYHLFTKRYKPWKYIYTEKLKTRDEARLKEKYFKSAAGRRWMKANLFDNKAGMVKLVYTQS